MPAYSPLSSSSAPASKQPCRCMASLTMYTRGRVPGQFFMGGHCIALSLAVRCRGVGACGRWPFFCTLLAAPVSMHHALPKSRMGPLPCATCMYCRRTPAADMPLMYVASRICVEISHTPPHIRARCRATSRAPFAHPAHSMMGEDLNTRVLHQDVANPHLGCARGVETRCIVRKRARRLIGPNTSMSVGRACGGKTAHARVSYEFMSLIIYILIYRIK